MASNGSVQKSGKNSWKLTVSGGFDGSGKRIRHTKTVHVADGSLDVQEKQARKQLALFIAEIEKGQVATSGKMTLTQFYEFWKKNYAIKKHEATTLSYNDFIFRRIKEAFGQKRLDKIEPKHLLSFYSNLAEPGIKTIQQKKDATEPPPAESLSTSTIRKHHDLLSSLFSCAVKWNMLPYNPADRVEPPKVKRKPKEIYNQDELGCFLEAMEDEQIKYRLMVLLALTGSLRREEIFGLQWEHIDFENNAIHIDQASVYIPGDIVTKDTKSKSSNRFISIPASVMTLLKQHKAEQSARRLKLGGTAKEGGKWQGDDKPEHDRVFTQWNGKPSHPHSFNTWVKRFIAKNGLPHISPHIFRHMSASYLIICGTDVRTVSGKLGHAQPSTTMNIYSHLLKSAEQETAHTMESFLQQTTEKAKQNKQAK